MDSALLSFLDLVSGETALSAPPAGNGNAPVVAVYFAASNDEDKLRQVDLDPAITFQATVDIQPLVKKWRPMSKDAYRLGEAADALGVHSTTQSSLKTSWNYDPIHHNGQDDAFITLVMALCLLQEISNKDTAWANVILMAIDTEGGVLPTDIHTHVTTEFGLAWTSVSSLKSTNWKSSIKTAHCILQENALYHPCWPAQRRMGVQSRDTATYPRWNTRSGPSGAKKVLRRVGKRDIKMSPDSEFVQLSNISEWLRNVMTTAATSESSSAKTVQNSKAIRDSKKDQHNSNDLSALSHGTHQKFTRHVRPSPAVATPATTYAQATASTASSHGLTAASTVKSTHNRITTPVSTQTSPSVTRDTSSNNNIWPLNPEEKTFFLDTFTEIPAEKLARCLAELEISPTDHSKP